MRSMRGRTLLHLLPAPALLAAGALLALPLPAPGLENTLAGTTFALVVAGWALGCVEIWRFLRRVIHRWRRAAARIGSLLVWTAIATLALLHAFFAGLAVTGGFMGSREVACKIRSADGVTYYLYRGMNWNDPGDAELLLRRGPFVVPLLRSHREMPEDWVLRGIDVDAHGHRLAIRRGGLADLYAQQPGGIVATIDGQPARVECE